MFFLTCQQCVQTKKKYALLATDWEEYHDISRHNDYLGYDDHAILNAAELRNRIDEMCKDASTNENKRDVAEVIMVFTDLLSRMHDSSWSWFLEYEYN